MSEEFEVKGPHEEVLEGGESHSSHTFNSQLAVLTAIMAAIGALLSYEASLTLGEAIIHKNEAAIHKTEASDQWNYYQAKSNKENISELAAKLTSGKDREESQHDAERYSVEKVEVKTKAEQAEELSQQADLLAERYLHVHHSWATGATALQIAISLAAIALLTRRKWLEYLSLLAAATGIGFGCLAWFGF